MLLRCILLHRLPAITEMTFQKEELVRDTPLTFDDFRQQVLSDYRLAVVSREASLIGRREVLRGKAKFGIFGDGKEVAQLALARAALPGDWRSGYYRDQTFAFATGICTVRQFFAQLYAHPDLNYEPMSGGRQMNAHFATPYLDANGNWLSQLVRVNSAADSSPTSSQLPRALGLALASKKYREYAGQMPSDLFSQNGNEVVFATIGDASTSEGNFWETLNAAGVLQVPLLIIVWDDGYGISVPVSYQTTKGNISEVCEGFRPNEKGGVDIYSVKGWDYPALVEVFAQATERARLNHQPALIHVQELTQPQGHSTSGSHERYKSAERLRWEKEYDCISRMRQWMLHYSLATEEELTTIEEEAKAYAAAERQAAWEDFNRPIRQAMGELTALLHQAAAQSGDQTLLELAKVPSSQPDLLRRDVLSRAKQALIRLRHQPASVRSELETWTKNFEFENRKAFTSHLYSETHRSALKVPEVKPVYSESSPLLNGYEILNRCFDLALEREPRLFAFGEDVGKIGDVNQGFAGLQAKYGEGRVFDTGIREQTIVGQGLGMAMRGLRPIAEIQYLDYLLFALQTLSDDVATLHYRSAGGQIAPLIVRTRGHRLEGIWHAGSPMGMILHAVRGMYVLVPRNMTQAAGFYNTLLQSDDAAIVVECLNGYRLKERLPDNIGSFTVPLGVPEILSTGDDVTLVTYGSCVRIALEAIQQLHDLGISVELIDVQTLLPFDLHHVIGNSVRKTNRLVIMDEDVPGGASAFIYQQVMEKQNIWRWLDSEPLTLTAAPNRPAYASDGDYFCKPQVEDIIETIYRIMHEADPSSYPAWY
ncbi:MAG: thiamine pyrophosphate-dependent enzyme [Chitinophagales bacterium]|nr:thiamine pyrophosphate-dependent enzyme [Chitinophagales bacterium]MDW8428560.1 thiamine pyrophosphate-dependent enzyme [Chitinophagales bacterium]